MVAANFIRHEACEACGSSDAKAVYDDGHTHCFGKGCGARTGPTGAPVAPVALAGGTIDVEVKAIPSRKLSLETAEKYSYGWGVLGGQKVQVAQYHNRETKRVVAQKVRREDKTFAWLGDPKKAGLFGAHLCRDGGKRIVITEGEHDAMACSQAQGNRWPVVSVRNGSSGAAKDIKANLEWLESYEAVVLMFDMDEAGRAAVEECAPLFTPGKCMVASLPLKDASDMLQAGKAEQLRNAVWDATPYRPDGIVFGDEVLDAMVSLGGKPGIKYPYEGLTKMTRGLRRGEIVTVCAGSGIGKSTFCREVAGSVLSQIPASDRIGYIALEENVGLSGLGFCTLAASKPMHLAEPPASREELQKLWAPYKERVILYNHWGSVGSGDLVKKINFMIRGMDCRWLVLDHLSIVVSGMDQNEDERRTIDFIMTSLRSLVENTQAGLVLVSHLKRLQGGQKGFEQGTEPQLSHLRGSAAIEQLSDIVIGLGRNQQCEETPNLARVRVLKNRWTGQTGKACYIQYSLDTGRLMECAGPEDDDDTREAFAAVGGGEFD